MEKVLQFLSELKTNNNREWFERHRDQYIECREKIIFTVEILIHEIRVFDKTVPLLNPKDCLFRIYRDVRFSEDKRPYKTHFGAFIANGGRKSEEPGYYIHLEPDNSFVGGGIYRPSAPILKSIRNFIAENGYEFEEVMNDKDFKSALPEVMEDRLKTAPKGFPADHRYIELLRYKSFAFSAHIPDITIVNNMFINETVSKFHLLYRINRLLHEALKE